MSRHTSPGEPAAVVPLGGGATGPTQRHLVCFPHAGALPTFYLPWFAHLRDRIALWGAVRDAVAPQLPPAHRWGPVVRRVAEQVTRLPGELLLYGHSMGALVAFETAAELWARGRRVTHLVVSGRVAPHRIPPDRGEWPDDPVELVRWVASTHGAIPEEVMADPELARAVGADLRADLALHDAYTPRGAAPLPVALTAIAGEDDPMVDVAELHHWRGRTTRDFSVATLPGGHMPGTEGAARIASMLDPPG